MNNPSTKNFISEDRFLYSCLEYEEKISLVHHSSKERISWPDLTNDDMLESQEFEPLLSSMLNWYKDNFPVLIEDNILSSKVVNDCVPPLVSLLKDTIYLFSYKYNMPFPLYDFSSNNNHEIWDIFSKNISEVFPLNSRLFEKYFHWAHAQEQKTDEPKFNPYKTSDSLSEDNGNNHRSSFRKDPYFKGQKHKNYKKSKFNHKSKHPHSISKEAEALAMAECKSAIEEIKLNPDIDFIELKPQNSYIRRLQHSEASAAELFSLSKGEDKSRAVVIYREKQV